LNNDNTVLLVGWVKDQGYCHGFLVESGKITMQCGFVGDKDLVGMQGVSGSISSGQLRIQIPGGASETYAFKNQRDGTYFAELVRTTEKFSPFSCEYKAGKPSATELKAMRDAAKAGGHGKNQTLSKMVLRIAGATPKSGLSADERRVLLNIYKESIDNSVSNIETILNIGN
jgi:hypothetical protein